MPFVSEVSKTISVEKSYTWTGDDGGRNRSYGKAVLKVTTNNDKVNYEVTMTTNVKELAGENWVDSSNQPYMGLYLSIGNNEIYNAYYAAKGKFPTKNGSSASGTIEVGAAVENIPVVLKISPSVNAVKKPSYWKTSEATLTRTYYTEVSGPTIKINDQLNNSFSINVTTSNDAINNQPKGLTTLKWGYTDSRTGTYINNQVIPLTRLDASLATRTVYAEATTVATYGSNKKSTKEVAIKQYYDPGDPGVPALTEGSFKNNRLTIKQPWTYLWTPAEGRGVSPLAGYRIRVAKNDQFIKGLVYNKDTHTITLGTGTVEYIDTEETANYVSFDPTNLGFKPGDTVSLRIHAYSKNGRGEQRWTIGEGEGKTEYSLFSAAKNSKSITVQNAGIVNVKVGGVWREGQVYVKANGSWHEAETVNIKTSSGWQESQ